MTKPKAELLKVDATSADGAIGFGSWRTPSSTRPIFVILDIDVQPSAITDGEVNVDVDESGGTTADYTWRLLVEAGLGATRPHCLEFYLQPGASYQVRNTSDPSGGNAINLDREYTQ